MKKILNYNIFQYVEFFEYFSGFTSFVIHIAMLIRIAATSTYLLLRIIIAVGWNTHSNRYFEPWARHIAYFEVSVGPRLLALEPGSLTWSEPCTANYDPVIQATLVKHWIPLLYGGFKEVKIQHIARYHSGFAIFLLFANIFLILFLNREFFFFLC